MFGESDGSGFQYPFFSSRLSPEAASRRVRGKPQRPRGRICHLILTPPSGRLVQRPRFVMIELDIRENEPHEIFILTTYTSILLPHRFGWGHKQLKCNQRRDS